MTKKEFKELLFVLLFSVINIAIAFLITYSLGIQNIVFYQSLTAINYTFTYEVIIFIVLSFIEAFIYDFKLIKSRI